MSSFWLQQGNQWLNAIKVFLLTCAQHASDKLEKIISDYLCLLPKLRMPVSYLLAKTHKSKEVIASSWASRPITALSSWFTSGPSTLLSVLGKIVLKCDRVTCPSSTPLSDTLDLVSRIDTLALRWRPHDRGRVSSLPMISIIFIPTSFGTI